MAEPVAGEIHSKGRLAKGIVTNYDVVVIGGGAAGFFAAIIAAESNPNLRILILEKGSNPLAKVRISGGGRCNVTHACYDPAELVKFYPRGARELRGAFTRFQPRDMEEWLLAHGVRLYTQPDGCIFPASDRSETIIDCFLAAAQRLGIDCQTHAGVNELRREGNDFMLSVTNGTQFKARNILLAAGGGSQSAYALAKSLGHTIEPPVPSLFTFTLHDQRLDGLMGVSVPEAHLQLLMTEQGKEKRLAANGPLLITHWGLSGPAVLRLSAWGARYLAETKYQANFEVNWLPVFHAEAYFSELQRVKDTRPHQQVSAGEPQGRLPKRLWKSLAGAAGIGELQTWGETAKAALFRLAEEATRGKYVIQGKGVFKEEFVTCGGVSLKEVDFKTMQSRLAPGVYFAGEVLDIDGLTGGFNFQSAWTTGWLAGKALAALLHH